MSWVDKFTNFINNINKAVNAFMGQKDPSALSIDGPEEDLDRYEEEEYRREKVYHDYGREEMNEYLREREHETQQIDPYTEERPDYKGPTTKTPKTDDGINSNNDPV